MAAASGTKSVLLVGLVVALAAVAIGKSVGRQSDLEIVASEILDARETRDADSGRPAPLFSQELEHFRILYEGGTRQDVADRIARALERGYSTIGRTLNSYPSERIAVVLYTNREFQDLTRSPSWATGRYDGRIRIAIGGALEPPRDLERIVTHELVHAVIASAAPRGVPAWLNEGLATYLESTDRSWVPEALRRASAIVPLERLVDGFGGLDEQSALVAYAESATAAEILCNQLGDDIGKFLQMVGNGSAIDQALLEFHVQPNAFESEWRRRVGLR
jgi:hypothetical protein